MTRNYIFLSAVTLLLIFSCDHNQEKASGKLFIIGGGNRTDEMLNELVDLAGIRKDGYMFVLPMASSFPDSAIIWTREDFSATGIIKIPGYNFPMGRPIPQPQLDSLRNAKLIYICGGDQSRFMSVVLNTALMDAICFAYKNGAIIAGTSAGAAVMSKKMITGNQKKHPATDAGFVTMEADNLEVTEGLGLLTDVIIDQHFIKRQRLNRLISAAIENPDELCVGIDESTAIIVDGDIATVTGNSQVVVISSTGQGNMTENGLLGAGGLKLSVYLPGQKFKLR